MNVATYAPASQGIKVGEAITIKRGRRKRGKVSPLGAESRWNRYPVEYSIVAFNQKGGSGERRGAEDGGRNLLLKEGSKSVPTA